MAHEHAVPEEKSDKVHGDKLEGVLDKTEDQGAQAEKGKFAPRMLPQDGDNGNGIDGPAPQSTDGKTMP